MKIGLIGSGVVAQNPGEQAARAGARPGAGDARSEQAGRTRRCSARDVCGNGKSQTEGWAQIATFKEAAAHGELLINATSGAHFWRRSSWRYDKVGPKILIDVANELDHSKGGGSAVLASQERCLAEKLQAAFPNLKVVKTLNTIGAPVMVGDPQALGGGDHTVFVSGNDAEAKGTVTALLKSFGWTDVLDLGDVSSARGPEMYLAMWIRLWGRDQDRSVEHQGRALDT